MNISAGLSSPTIEGRIILTAENNMTAGFDAARAELAAFAKEFSKVQATINANINTNQRQQTQVARQQVRDAQRVNTLIGGMFKAFVASATGAFTALTIMGEKYNDVYLKNVESLQRTTRLLSSTTISTAAMNALVDKVVKTYSRESRQQTREELTAIAARVRTGRGTAADVAETQRRYGLLADVGVTTQRGMTDVQQTVQRAITSGRTTGLVQLLSAYHPTPLRDQELETLRDLFETIKDPAQAEAEFFNIIAKWQQEFPDALKGAATELADQTKSTAELAREMETLHDFIADEVHPLWEKYAQILADGLHWFNTLTEEQKEAAVLLGGIVVAMGGIGAAWIALGVALRVAAATLGTATAAATGTAAPAAGGALGALLRSRAVRGTAIMAAGSYIYANREGFRQSQAASEAERNRATPHHYKLGEDPASTAPWYLRNFYPENWPFKFGGGQGGFNIEGRQHGGPVSGGTPYIVGEGGPEMFTPTQAGGITPMRSGSGRNQMARFNQSLAEATGSVNQFGSALELVSNTLQKVWLELSEMQGGGGGGGGGGDGYGGGDVYGSSSSSGDLAANQQAAYNAFRELGYDDESAKIAVGNLSGESLRNPADTHADPSRRNPGQRAHGIASWDQFRSNRIRQKFGKSPEQMTVAEQVRAMDWEMKNFYPGAYADLTNPNLSEEQRMYGLVKKFESPADPGGQTAVRTRIKRGMKLQPWPGASGPAGRERDPLNIPQQQSSVQLGRGQIDVNMKLDRQLAMSRPTTVPASNFDLGVNVDRTGSVFSRPGDPAFPPPLPYGVA